MIEKVPNASKVSDEVKTRYVAAARYMRAMSYFYWCVSLMMLFIWTRR